MMLTAEQSLDKNLLINFSPLLIVAIFGFTVAILNSCSKIDTHYIPTPKEECIRENECKYA